jgi:hypothetical protein
MNQERKNNLEVNKNVYLEIKDNLIADGCRNYWILIQNGKVVSINKNKCDVKLPTEGDFYLKCIGYNNVINIL